jgi:hypothetical protein
MAVKRILKTSFFLTPWPARGEAERVEKIALCMQNIAELNPKPLNHVGTAA